MTNNLGGPPSEGTTRQPGPFFGRRYVRGCRSLRPHLAGSGFGRPHCGGPQALGLPASLAARPEPTSATAKRSVPHNLYSRPQGNDQKMANVPLDDAWFPNSHREKYGLSVKRVNCRHMSKQHHVPSS